MTEWLSLWLTDRVADIMTDWLTDWHHDWLIYIIINLDRFFWGCPNFHFFSLILLYVSLSFLPSFILDSTLLFLCCHSSTISLTPLPSPNLDIGLSPPAAFLPFYFSLFSSSFLSSSTPSLFLFALLFSSILSYFFSLLQSLPPFYFLLLCSLLYFSLLLSLHRTST